jgi:hypothetical protein
MLCFVLIAPAAACHRSGGASSPPRVETPTPINVHRAIHAKRHAGLHLWRSRNNDDPLNVIESENLGADWDCDTSVSCTHDYLDLLERAESYAAPVAEPELRQMFREYGLSPPYQDPIPAAELRDDIIDRLNAWFLFDGYRERRLEVVTTAIEHTPDGVKKTLLFRDPWVGAFKGYLLLPAGAGPFPSVVAVHGHGQSAESYLQDFPEVLQLQRLGFAVLVITLRLDNADEHEDRLCRAFLRRGLTMLSVHVYEVLLGRKYLAHLFGEQTAGGLLGHSGGSIDITVAIRVAAEAFDAAVVDAVGYFIGDWNAKIIDEAVPTLHPFHDLINDFSTAAVPVLQVPYGYVGAWTSIYAFFEEHLEEPGRCSSPGLADSPDCT